MKASFENSVSVLVRAYMNDTLEHSTCRACAVTNLIGCSYWGRLFLTVSFEGTKTPHEQLRAGDGEAIVRFLGMTFVSSTLDPLHVSQIAEARKAIDDSGYSIDELARIEYAFESAPFGKSEDDWMFNGLMAVVDVLADIHGVDLSVKETAIGQFKEVQALKLV